MEFNSVPTNQQEKGGGGVYWKDGPFPSQHQTHGVNCSVPGCGCWRCRGDSFPGLCSAGGHLNTWRRQPGVTPGPWLRGCT